MTKDVINIEVKGNASFERLIERLSKIKPRFYFLSENVWSPNIDVYRIGTDVIIKVELPGVNKDAVSIKLKDRILSIEGARWDPDSKSRQNFFLMEIEYGRFFREVELPFDVDGEKSDAVYENGFLVIRFPLKKKEVKKIEL
jgi:HSP20 family protein